MVYKGPEGQWLTLSFRPGLWRLIYYKEDKKYISHYDFKLFDGWLFKHFDVAKKWHSSWGVMYKKAHQLHWLLLGSPSFYIVCNLASDLSRDYKCHVTTLDFGVLCRSVEASRLLREETIDACEVRMPQCLKIPFKSLILKQSCFPTENPYLNVVLQV